jgi:predicted NBD/HSP70 family sugar kinase
VRGANALAFGFGIGISIPGRPETSPENPVFTPRILWPVLDLKARLERATGLRVKMDNVANACVLSEVWLGESDGIHDLVVVNVSEGIGTGIFVNGRILRGREGMAGEFGHVQIESDGPLCPCGGTGCWESFASNRAALLYYQEITGKPCPPSFEALLRMAQNDNAFAVQAIDKMSLSLGRGLRMISSAMPNAGSCRIESSALKMLVGPGPSQASRFGIIGADYRLLKNPRSLSSGW